MFRLSLIYKALLIFNLSIIFTANQSFATDIQSYNKLVEEWPKIFPDGNRNAASPRFFKYLIDQGANVNDRNSPGMTPLKCAEKNGHHMCVEYLKSKGAIF